MLEKRRIVHTDPHAVPARTENSTCTTPVGDEIGSRVPSHRSVELDTLRGPPVRCWLDGSAYFETIETSPS